MADLNIPRVVGVKRRKAASSKQHLLQMRRLGHLRVGAMPTGATFFATRHHMACRVSSGNTASLGSVLSCDTTTTELDVDILIREVVKRP